MTRSTQASCLRASPRRRRPSARLIGRCVGLAVALVVLLSPDVASGQGAKPAKDSARQANGAVNMEFRDTDLPTVLRAVCQGAGVDFVLDPNVKGQVTAKLRNTSWNTALDIILKSHGLEAKREGNTLLISPASASSKATQQTRVAVKKRPDKKFDLDASGADIRDALRDLSAAAGLNIVAAKDVTGTITASLHGLRAEEILIALADSVGASIADKGNLILVTPRPIRPAAAPDAKAPAAAADAPPPVEVKRLPGGKLALRAKAAPTRDVLRALAQACGLNIVADAAITSTVTLDLAAIAPDDALAAVAIQAGLRIRPVGAVLYAEPAPATVQTEAFRLRYADAKEIGEVLKASIEGAKVSIATTNNLVVVTGTPQMVATAREIIERVEKAPVQVTIETRIIETNLTGDENIGMEWSNTFGINATTPTIPHTWPLSSKSSSNYIPAYDPSETTTNGNSVVPLAAKGDFQFGFLSSTGLSFVLNMLQQKSSSRTIANPTITTVENQEATVNVVTKYPIATYQVSGDTGVLSISGFEYKEYGTILKVTPRVCDGHIIMDIHPEVSRQSGVTRFQGAELPVISSQETTTKVRIKDGDTLVIAGLIREDTQHSRNSTPWFSKIPLLGSLFRSRRTKIDERRNLLIFITPHIVGPDDFARSAELKRKRTEPVPSFEDCELPTSSK